MASKSKKTSSKSNQSELLKLEMHGLDGKFWENRFVEHDIHFPLSEEYNGKEKMNKLLLYAKDEKEKDILRKCFLTQLAFDLEQESLDSFYWENIFRELKIERREQFRLISNRILQKLLTKSQNEIDYNVLKQLCEPRGAENKKELYIRRENEMKNIGQNLQLDHAKSFSENSERRNKLDDDSWFKNLDDRFVMERIQREKGGTVIVKRNHLDNSEIVKKIGAGQVLRGQFIHRDLQASSTYRQQLIDVNRNVDLMTPAISENMECLEFYDKKQSAEFEASLNKFGRSLAFATFVGPSIFKSGKVQVSHSSTEITEEKSTTNRQESFVHLCQLLHVPTASFTISNQNIYFTKSALDALKTLNNEFKDTCKEIETESFKENCKIFFNNFGSHYFTGIYHFGGRYKWTVTSSSTSDDSRVDNYKIAKSALQGSVSGGYNWFGIEVGGSHQTENEEIKKERKFTESTKVSKNLEKFGGPCEVDDIHLWKQGLVENNKTWFIIDKDVSKKCYDGVWELIKCDEDGDFTDKAKFATALEKVWEENSGMTEYDAMSWAIVPLGL